MDTALHIKRMTMTGTIKKNETRSTEHKNSYDFHVNGLENGKLSDVCLVFTSKNQIDNMIDQLLDVRNVLSK